METATNSSITVETIVNAPVEKVWTSFTDPQHIKNWYQASPDWHAPYAENDLRVDGSFKTTMAAKDGSFSFDFEGVYTNVVAQKTIEYTLGDGRKVRIDFTSQDDQTRVVETFDPENTNSLDMQKTGWQAILDSFKHYTEGNN